MPAPVCPGYKQDWCLFFSGGAVYWPRMHIPWESIEEATLERLLAEIVTRDGTDYGLVEHSTAAKVRAARKALEQGRAQLHWDEESETAALVATDQVREEAARQQQLRRQAGIKSGGENA